jgi:hypothetical protein
MTKLLKLGRYWSSVLAAVCVVLAIIAAPVGELKADPGSGRCCGVPPPVFGQAWLDFVSCYHQRCGNCCGNPPPPSPAGQPQNPAFTAWLNCYNTSAGCADGIWCGPDGFYENPPSCSGLCFIGECKPAGVDNQKPGGGERIPGKGNITVFFCTC